METRTNKLIYPEATYTLFHGSINGVRSRLQYAPRGTQTRSSNNKVAASNRPNEFTTSAADGNGQRSRSWLLLVRFAADNAKLSCDDRCRFSSKIEIVSFSDRPLAVEWWKTLRSSLLWPYTGHSLANCCISNILIEIRCLGLMAMWFPPAHTQAPFSHHLILKQLNNLKSRWNAAANQVKISEIKIFVAVNQVENYESTEKHFHRDYFHRGETIFEHKLSCIGPKPTKAKTFKIYRQKLSDYVSCLSYKKWHSNRIHEICHCVSYMIYISQIVHSVPIFLIRAYIIQVYNII